ncbi:exported hypothetical protein [Candidatus Sulfotelmatobacter kueseliae]|uniref:Uncharacterized protein n=1 Tax=Candidatus Sulfotelmatobacter kueseliae TaxID=2042962 RepID=A0A2U3KYA2_9BACT|nr:exported hypothetical protein [Candidatus Sulfotelmatobacter kueseliae]
MSIPRSLMPNLSTVLGLGVAVLLSSSAPELQSRTSQEQKQTPLPGAVLVYTAMKHDLSAPLALQTASADDAPPAECEGAACGTSPGVSPDDSNAGQERPPEPIPPPIPPPALSPAGIAVEQTSQGPRPAAPVLESFGGLGAGFEGPQGTAKFRSPSDDSLAVGPDHIVQIVNARIAVYSKKGRKYDKTGTVLYGAVATKSVWAGFGGVCEARNNGDAVVRYDQLAGRWLIVMPMFSRIRPGDFPEKSGLAPGEPVPPGQLAKSGWLLASQSRRVSLRNPESSLRPVRRLRLQPIRLSLLRPGRGRPRQRREFGVCATQLARGPIRWGRIIATRSSVHCSRTTHVPPSGRMATTCQPAPAMT